MSFAIGSLSAQSSALVRLYQSGDKWSGLRTHCAKTSKPVSGLTQYLDTDPNHSPILARFKHDWFSAQPDNFYNSRSGAIETCIQSPMRAAPIGLREEKMREVGTGSLSKIDQSPSSWTSSSGAAIDLMSAAILFEGSLAEWAALVYRQSLIPPLTDQDAFAQSRSPIDMIAHGRATSLFHASEQWSTMSS